MDRNRTVTRTTLLALAIVFAGCGKKIGDECRTSIDCSQESERLCDISQPGGYCTLDGCDERSCPDEAVCIRFFPRLFLDRDRKCMPAAGGPECAASEICLPEGVCAPRSAERRYCASSCDGDGDCRSDYECRLAGTEGSIALVSRPDATVRFCAPAISR
jgi:hypothetical protein